MTPRTLESGNQHILYDADAIEEASAELFDAERLRRRGALTGAAQGRGATHFVTLPGAEAVLRHYRRGGMVARFNEDRYLWQGLSATRPWREWLLLAQLQRLQLPAPAPLAARVVRHGLWYRADLLTRRIGTAGSLAQRLRDQALSPMLWSRIGACIRRFHDAAVFHADLNAHNILLDASDHVYLIDFDRGEMRSANAVWREANLKRLRRSLDKLTALHPGFAFDTAAWSALCSGYNPVMDRHGTGSGAR